jgi:hypothetical protein
MGATFSFLIQGLLQMSPLQGVLSDHPHGTLPHATSGLQLLCPPWQLFQATGFGTGLQGTLPT